MYGEPYFLISLGVQLSCIIHDLWPDIYLGVEGMDLKKVKREKEFRKIVCKGESVVVYSDSPPLKLKQGREGRIMEGGEREGWLEPSLSNCM